jgi:hypothetical protein
MERLELDFKTICMAGSHINIKPGSAVHFSLAEAK